MISFVHVIISAFSVYKNLLKVYKTSRGQGAMLITRAVHWSFFTDWIICTGKNSLKCTKGLGKTTGEVAAQLMEDKDITNATLEQTSGLFGISQCLMENHPGTQTCENEVGIHSVVHSQ